MHALIAVLATIVGPAVSNAADDPPREPPAAEAAMSLFERAVCGSKAVYSTAEVRRHLEQVLRIRIDAVNRACGLSDGQRKKLELAGRGEIAQLFERLEDRRQAFEISRNGGNDAMNFVRLDAETAALRIAFRCAPFNDNSLFAKTLRNVLTSEQAAQMEQRKFDAANSPKKITAANVVDLVRTAKIPKNVYRIQWNRDGSRQALWEFQKPVEISGPMRNWVVGTGKAVVGFDFSAAENVVAIADPLSVTIIDLATGSEIPLRGDKGQSHPTFSPDGTLLATGGYHGPCARLWSTATGELVREFDVGAVEGGLTPVFSPDGRTLAIGNRNSTTRLFEVSSGRLLHVLDKVMTQGMEFDPTGRMLAAAYVDGSLRLWDVQSGTLKRSAHGAADELYSVNWSYDGQVLVTSGHQSAVTLWNPQDLSILNELDAPEWTISARFSPDGTKLMFAGGSRMPSAERYVETWAVP